MIDVEELAEQRRQVTPRSAGNPAGAAESADGSAECTSPQFLDTQRMLREQRAGDRTFEARRLLAIIRADRRPTDVASLRAAITTEAAAEGMTVADVHEHLDRALRLEDSSLSEWEKQLRRPKPRLGRGAVLQHQQQLHEVAQ